MAAGGRGLQEDQRGVGAPGEQPCPRLPAWWSTLTSAGVPEFSFHQCLCGSFYPQEIAGLVYVLLWIKRGGVSCSGSGGRGFLFLGAAGPPLQAAAAQQCSSAAPLLTSTLAKQKRQKGSTGPFHNDTKCSRGDLRGVAQGSLGLLVWHQHCSLPQSLECAPYGSQGLGASPQQLFPEQLSQRLLAGYLLQVSSRTGEGVSGAVADIKRERRGRDVYVIGAANVGKSAFIRALVK